jgi:hypothetical protein
MNYEWDKDRAHRTRIVKHLSVAILAVVTVSVPVGILLTAMPR